MLVGSWGDVKHRRDCVTPSFKSRPLSDSTVAYQYVVTDDDGRSFLTSASVGQEAMCAAATMTQAIRSNGGEEKLRDAE